MKKVKDFIKVLTILTISMVTTLSVANAKNSTSPKAIKVIPAEQPYHNIDVKRLTSASEHKNKLSFIYRNLLNLCNTSKYCKYGSLNAVYYFSNNNVKKLVTNGNNLICKPYKGNQYAFVECNKGIKNFLKTLVTKCTECFLDV